MDAHGARIEKGAVEVEASAARAAIATTISDIRSKL
jgi:hypothetical protein